MGLEYSKIRNEIQKIPLNDLLDQLEVDITHIGQGNTDHAQKLLIKMDEVQQRIDNMVQKKVLVQAESAQFDYLLADLEKNAKNFLRDLGGAKELDILRKQRPAGQDFRWWHLDDIYKNQKKKKVGRLLVSVGSIGMVLVLLGIVYITFLKPDPAVTGKYIHQMNAEQALTQGDYEKAIYEINQAIKFAPSDAELLSLRGVIQTKTGNLAQADEDFNAAEQLTGNRINFLLLRTRAWLSAGEFQYSIYDSQKILREDPESAEGYLYLGRANELEKNYQAAIKAYETASNLAESQGKTELNASIRVSLAIMMQTISGMPPTNQQTPTP